MKIKTTYSQVTPESASIGDFSETGWIDQKGERFDSVDEAIEFLRQNGAVHASSSDFHVGVCYSTDFSCIDYTDGTEEELSFHLEGFTEEQERTIFESFTCGFKNKSA